MATVFLARLSGVGGFQRFVAIKRLHPHLAREPEFIEMFLEEARLSARIHHPNVVPILEIGESDQGYYIVMEYVEGDTLGRLLARSAQTGVRLPTKVGLRVVIDMLAGLDAAHELKDDDGNGFGIVHRDISPQNVLVGVDGSSRLSDFGVARATSKLSTTRTGQLKGKLAYMAPEQAKGTKDIDRRADIFASGIVLWEVLACRRLFKGDGEADTLNRVLHEPIPPVRAAAPTIPAALEAVVAKALERDRAKRYDSAAEFADSLERASRVVGSLGTHKDVAQYLEVVLGTEISQQREVVRAWLARSEPSRHGIEGLVRPEPTGVTRVERGGDGTPSSVSSISRARAVSQPSSVPSLPGMPSQPGLPAGSPSSGVSAVSSVGSAVIPTGSEQATGAGAVAPIATPVAPRSRARVWPWVALLVVVVAGAGVWMRFPRGPGAQAAGAEPSAAVAAVARPPAVASPSASAASSARAPAAGAVALVASSSSGVAVESAPPAAPPGAQRRVWWHPARPVPAPAQGAAPAAAPAAAPVAAPAPTAAPVPDDISRNPYR
jgi:serine/threonine-protein kinase